MFIAVREPIYLGKPCETLIGHDVSVTAMNMKSNPSWVNHDETLKRHGINVNTMNIRANPSG
jgi:hypothetical protein